MIVPIPDHSENDLKTKAKEFLEDRASISPDMVGDWEMSKIDKVLAILEEKTSIDSETGCWEYLSRSGNGYGHLTIDRIYYQVHRLSAELFLGYVPNPNFWVLHQCNNRCCWNPAHLYIGTPKENSQQREADGHGRKKGNSELQTHCKKGHELTPENIYTKPTDEYRQCKICRDQSRKEWRERKSASKENVS